MPMPLSFTLTTASPFSRRVAIEMRPPWFVYLAALLSRLANTCVSRTGSPPTHMASGSSSTDELVPEVVEHGPAGLDRRLDDARQVERLLADLDDAARNARHFEQIVDEAIEVMDLALHHFAGLLRARIVERAGQLHDLEAVRDRRQRIAQLVPERREEFVLAAIRRAQGLLVLQPLGEVAADLVLARARANRRLRRAQERRDARRPLEQRDVAERAPRLGGFRRVGARPRQDQDRQVRPRRLPRQPRRRAALCAPPSGALRRPAPPPRRRRARSTSASRVGERRGLDPGAVEQIGRDVAVPRGRRHDQDPQIARRGVHLRRSVPTSGSVGPS